MKKLSTIALLLVLCVLVTSVSAQSATALPGTLTRPSPQGNRTFGANPVIPGESPTTGLPVGSHSYMPILVQIDNTPRAMPQWGISKADIIYEMPLSEPGWTRLTAVFSDVYPDEAGPVRSGRYMHADLREEWDGPIVFYGAQEDKGSNMREALKEYGVNKKNLSIDGHANKYSKDYLVRVKYHYAPSNVSVYVAKLREFIIKDTKNYSFVPRPFLFTDAPQYAGPLATSVEITRRDNQETAATYIYDAANNGYARHNFKGPYIDLLAPETPIFFSNVIIQRTKVGYNGHSSMPIMPNIVGSGAADIFIAGRYIAGSWTRSALTERTVFLDEQGNELQLARGKSWIVVADDATVVKYSGDANAAPPIIAPVTSAVPSPDDAEAFEVEEPAQVPAGQVETQPEQAVAQPQQAEAPAEQPEQAEGPSGTPTNATVRTRNKGDLNFREGPSKDTKRLSMIPFGAKVEVLEQGEEWTKITYRDVEGYVMTTYLDFGN